jgi:2-oxoglutarate ferredoxin oxidoreductase subunit gamma
MAAPAPEDDGAIAVPATAIANELGDVRVANVVLLGAYNARRRIVPPDLLFDQLSYAFGGLEGRLLEMNKAAYERGAQADG